MVREDTTPKLGPNDHESGSASLRRSPLALYHFVLLPMIYTVDFKAVLGRFIQRWSRELTRINDVVIPCPLLHLYSLPLLHLGLYIAALTPLPRGIPETLIHNLLIRIRVNYQDVEVE